MLIDFVPESLSDLSKLKFLNLSQNHLNRNIPSTLANLYILESLDLSYSNLKGPIPTSLSNLTKLTIFNVSFNDGLSGPIQTNSPQFEDNMSYVGDTKLCGEPILHACSDMLATPSPLKLHEDHDSSKLFLVKWVDEWIAILGLCIGFVVGF